MGSLLKETPHSETNATLELLDRWGVTREGLKRLRSASRDEQRTIAQMIEHGISSAEVQKIIVVRNPILKFLGTVDILASTKKFVAKEKFVRDNGHKTKVKISYLCDNFTLWFLSGDSKIEDPMSVHMLRYYKLRKSSMNVSIITELSVEELVETTLSESFSLMEKQGKGEDGILLNNSCNNIFYIRDQNGVLRTVIVRWDGEGWVVFASSVEHMVIWADGIRVFSRAT